MNRPGRSPSPADRPPWDPANGMRVGAVAGGLVGAALVAITGLTSFWIVAFTGAAGGAVGFWTEKRKRSDRTELPDPNGSPDQGLGQ